MITDGSSLKMSTASPPAAAVPASRRRTHAAIRVAGVNKHFKELEVLRNIDFEVGTGEIVALVGASGCGKSTLLNIVSGLMSPDTGTLSIDGAATPQKGVSPFIAYMFQEDRLLPWRTTLDNVAFGLETRPMLVSERNARAREALALVGLSDFERAYPHELSGGMRSRAALARSLVVEPRILLMDEPFSKLDPQIRAQMHEELLRIQAMKAVTILFVTHDVEEAIVLADRVVVLAPRPGRIQEIDDVRLPRPRLPTDAAVSESIRQLRMKI